MKGEGGCGEYEKEDSSFFWGGSWVRRWRGENAESGGAERSVFREKYKKMGRTGCSPFLRMFGVYGRENGKKWGKNPLNRHTYVKFKRENNLQNTNKCSDFDKKVAGRG